MTDGFNFRFDHVHVYCSDVPASERWFVDSLGATVKDRRDQDGIQSVFLALGDNSVILRSVPEGPGQAIEAQYGLHHFGLLVDDLYGVSAALKARGVEFTVEPHQFRPGVKIAFIKGPDEVTIELLQRGS